MASEREILENAVAIIGMACRFPGARNVEEFWQNLRDGVESIRFFADDELLAAGVDPELLRNPDYVKAQPVLEGIEWFDAGFFGYSPREAELLEPQQRLFLECAWQALEDGGYDSETQEDRIGVYGGVAEDTYLFYSLLANPDLIRTAGLTQIELGNSKDYTATRVSYKLNLRGPSVTVQTACSTSLVAVHLACQSLASGESDMALAGGAAVMVPQPAGYFYHEGHIESPDGHCRTFDAQAGGSIFGSGVGIVLLKRLPDALRDRDCIRAVIRGSAMNNDGSLRVSFTAPGVDGQTEVIAEALALARVSPETITYVEAHGTGTALGDPIEVAALTQAFRNGTDKTGYCALGSVKTNFGHLNTAAGAAGLIKTVLALQHRALPPSLHFKQPNPQIDFANSPFFVNTEYREWNPVGIPRRAGVSSFGMGGTNVHLVLEQAPEQAPEVGPRPPGKPYHLLTLSAKTPSALESKTDQLVRFLRQHPDAPLADVAYTSQVGRRAFHHRRTLVCSGTDDAIQALETRDPARLLSSAQSECRRPIAFLLPGLGDHHINMGLGLYRHEPLFREHVDRGAEILQPLLGTDIREVLYPRGQAEPEPTRIPTPDLEWLLQRDAGAPDEATQRLNQTCLAQPILFVLEYALARLWMEWGITPQALLGHSLGEYVAACLAGVFSLEDALRLVSQRAQMIQQLQGGAMLAVLLSEAELRPLLSKQLGVAAVNDESLCVASGVEQAVIELEQRLGEMGVACRRLPTYHAFHSEMMEPIREPLAELVRQIPLSVPQIPFVSNVTGTWITPAEATDPNYWAAHVCRTVRFADGVRLLLAEPDRVLMEIGPGQSLSTLVQQNSNRRPGQVVLASMRHRHDRQPDEAVLLTALGKLWLAGVRVQWSRLDSSGSCRRIPLPTYPFERQRYWIAPQAVNSAPAPLQPSGPVGEPAPVAAAVLHPRPELRNLFVAPRTELEQRVAEVYEALLGLAPVGIHDNYFELGGNSLLIARLLAQVRDRCEVRLPVQAVFAAPTVSGLAQLIEQVHRKGGMPATLAETKLDLEAEAAWDDTLEPTAAMPAERTAEPQAVLLTGATGFLGAFLLYELLARTKADVYCLVRAANLTEAGQRIQKNLERYQLRSDEMRARVVPVLGDLSRPFLGVAQFEELAGKIDAIYHNGAWVNWIYPYTALQSTNVLGAKAILQLAGRVRIKPVHYVSSTAVFDAVPYAEAPTVQETDLPVRWQGMPNGYCETKWVAEKLMRTAHAHGIPVSIYRSAYVAGHSQTGVCNESDFIFRMAKGCIQLGKVPDEDIWADISPVDYVSRAIVYLSRQKESAGQVFHLVNPRLASWREIIQWLESFGYPLQKMSYGPWRAELEQESRRTPENALIPLLSYFPEKLADHTGARRFDCRQALEALAGTRIACPPVDDRLWNTYFGYLIRTGFLPAPVPSPTPG